MPESKKELTKEEIKRAAQIKEAEDLKNAARRLFTTKDGIKIAKAMMKTCQMYSLDIDMLDDEKVRSLVSRSFLYRFFIIGMLTPQQRMAIESPEEKEN